VALALLLVETRVAVGKEMGVMAWWGSGWAVAGRACRVAGGREGGVGGGGIGVGVAEMAGGLAGWLLGWALGEGLLLAWVAVAWLWLSCCGVLL
jgi:hypothetical protein